MKKQLLSIYFILALSLFSFSQTNVSGNISSNTTWTVANSPYTVTGNILVQSGVTLTIEPGVTIQFNSGLYLKVNGALIAEGTKSNNIYFTSNLSSKGQGDWDKIWLETTSATFDSDDNYMSGTIFKYCKTQTGIFY